MNTHNHFRLEREARVVRQIMPGSPEGGEYGYGPEYGHEVSFGAYESLPYDSQMEYMGGSEWMNSTLNWQTQMQMQQMQQYPWYQSPQMFNGGFPFDAPTQGHYMPYGYMYHGSQAWQGHPAWGPQSSASYAPPNPEFGEPPYPEPTPGHRTNNGRVVFRVQRGSRVSPRLSQPGFTRPEVRPEPEPRDVPRPRTPYPDVRPPDRTPSHPYDRDGRLAAAYAPYFNSSDPTVRATAQRWWDQAVRILENHPNDTVIFNQLVRGARENLGRATEQHNSVEATQREWSERVGSPRHTMRVSVPSGDRAAAIVITRNGDEDDRILYYPNSSSPFWDMRSADRAREWGIVFNANTYASGRFPSSVELRFYGEGNFSVGGVAGVRVPQSNVVIGAEAEGRQRELAEQERREPLHEITLNFGRFAARAIEIENTVTFQRTRILPTEGTQYARGFSLRRNPEVGGQYMLRFYEPGTYRVGAIYERDGGIRWQDVTVRPRSEGTPPRRIEV